ncbi:MAG TPA: hypothetical protein DCR97_10590 [Deltaproteobacteria bacterium]|nr:hypothetical protein [Deltaproteobacteria bacterium]
MDEELLLELTQKRLMLLKQFKKALIEERDAIISFSLEGITRANNVKEELLKKIEYLDEEQQSLVGQDSPKPPQSSHWVSLRRDLETNLKEVQGAMEKNMRLLNFSMDHVKNSIEHIVRSINKASYGRRREAISMMAPRTV